MGRLEQDNINRLVSGLDNKEYWQRILNELDRPRLNAERQDRRHNTIRGEEYFNDGYEVTVFDTIYVEHQDPESIIIQCEESRQLSNALSKLSEKDAFVVTELFLHFKTLTTVSREMGITVPAVRKRKIRILTILRTLLIEQGFCQLLEW
ncbi:RNA polymerase sigma factor [Levilactobacillus andaensis]|uniref:RNA polymerase sigma factor n=1 Tax=Levilactobacillus andaensis TaxID=2799570 RepID=UPI0019457E33|nr:sigma-70 family RNA polymerase sigma factor [Levilactobacillus andaensis]